MQETALPRGRVGPISFIADRVRGAVDSNDSNADWITPAASELYDLISQVVDHAIDLFDHRFGQYFDFDADFYCRDRASTNFES